MESLFDIVNSMEKAHIGLYSLLNLIIPKPRDNRTKYYRNKR